jgi:hypothetical protein
MAVPSLGPLGDRHRTFFVWVSTCGIYSGVLWGARFSFCLCAPVFGPSTVVVGASADVWVCSCVVHFSLNSVLRSHFAEALYPVVFLLLLMGCCVLWAFPQHIAFPKCFCTKGVSICFPKTGSVPAAEIFACRDMIGVLCGSQPPRVTAAFFLFLLLSFVCKPTVDY